jgi:hypothetical protein
MYRIFGLLAALFVVVSCATSVEQSLNVLQAGMDKDSVLKSSGSPWISRRINSEDLWIYRFYKHDQEFRKEIRFKEGRLVTVGPSLPFPNETDELRDADTIDDYSKAAQKKNEQYNKGFKEVPAQDND